MAGRRWRRSQWCWSRALSLAGTWLGWAAPPREITLALHLVFAPYGFMGMLSLGMSYILVPMFALADVPRERTQLTSCALAVAALVLAAWRYSGSQRPRCAARLCWPAPRRSCCICN